MSATPQEADRGTVVIVDDAAEVVEPVRLILEITGYRVVALAEGVGAGALIRSVRPALTILDLRLPDTDGWDILEALRRDPATAALPVLICTALPGELEPAGRSSASLGARPCSSHSASRSSWSGSGVWPTGPWRRGEMAAMWNVPLEPSARIPLKPEDRPAGGGPRGNGPEPEGQPEIAVGTDPPVVRRGVTAPPADEFPCEWWPPD